MRFAQSGDVTAVINVSAAAVIKPRASIRSASGKVLAGRNGIVGALSADSDDTSLESPAAPAALRHTPGGVRLVPLQAEKHRPAAGAIPAADRGVPRHDIISASLQRWRRFGGHLPQVSQLSPQLDYPTDSDPYPKTVDNDLPHTDCCPVLARGKIALATSIREASLDVASMAPRPRFSSSK